MSDSQPVAGSAGRPRPVVCIVSPYAYPLFNPSVRSIYGGSEVRLALLARTLAARGNFDVRLVVFDHGQPRVETREGVTIVSRAGEHPLLPLDLPTGPPARVGWVRRWKEKRGILAVARAVLGAVHVARAFLTGLPRRIARPFLVAGYAGGFPVFRKRLVIYDEVDADAYVLAGNSDLAAELAFWCSRKRRSYVFAAGSDSDFDPGFLEKPDEAGIYGLPGRLMNWVIENATLHVVQNETQKRRLLEGWHRESILIRNPMDLAQGFPRRGDGKTVLWVGKSDRIKRPEVLMRAARALPNAEFVVVMNLSDPALHARMLEEAASLPNVTVLEFVPFTGIERHFAEATIFLSTSAWEGFPNTFLQAAKYGVPIVSQAVDPDGMLTRHRSGIACGGDEAKMVAALDRLLRDEAERRVLEEGGQSYVREHHDKDRVAAAWEDALRLAISRTKGIA